ncbi:unnamed protein product [Medioppia subpectinata]|uniref:Uncharacterized protein n=1 Tax=Medioppia subpectinata TaxID=1979941 RepID=A0A7R9Q064_9ACAR|nr:unnamed protein product [Medioppia subpectinata]CAG2107779.1 unnamed protein product [Medioppia subpectinata]
MIGSTQCNNSCDKMSTTYDFTGRVALITGSSSGIGAATALLLAKSGANVVITGRNADNVSKVCKECTDVSPKGLKALPVVADVTKEEDLDRLLDTTIKTFGKLDILVNNVGFGPLSSITDDNYVENHRSGKRFSSYCMSKAALDMFTKAIAVELGPKGIRVNSVNPGYIYTNFCQTNFEMTDSEGRELWDKLGANYPVGRVGESLDVANAVAYLASDQASFITGTKLYVDGGHIASNTLITGSSSGIGAATALLLAKSGANVVITGRIAENVNKICKQCTEVSPKGLKALPVVADVTKEEDVDRLLDTTIKTFAYSMSKAAMDMFAKCIAVDLGPKGIRVNSVNPGAVRTNIIREASLSDEQINAIWDRMGSQYPVGRCGEGLDIANAVAYLASDQASFVTGTILVVDGEMKHQVLYAIIMTIFLMATIKLSDGSDHYWGHNPYSSLGYYNPVRPVNRPLPNRRKYPGQGVRRFRPFRNSLYG